MSEQEQGAADAGGTQRIKRFQEILSGSTQELIARAELAPGERVLDIGCGDGAVALLLAERVGATGLVYALDMSAEKLARLSERAADRGLNNIKLLHGLAETILPTLEPVDAVYARFVLMHVDEPRRLLEQMHLVLTAGGRAMLEEPIIGVTYDHPGSGVWEQAIAAYRMLCAAQNIDPDFGLRLPREMAASRFEAGFARQVQPVLSAEAGREYLIAAVEGHREEYLEHSVLSPDEYQELLDTVCAYGDSGVDYCAFHGVMQVLGNKTDQGVKLMSENSKSVDVVIIGAGPCGIAVADELRKHQIKSLILEAGALPPTETGAEYGNMEEYRRALEPAMVADESYWAFESDNEDYDWIRIRTAGGRTLRWNGWMARPATANFHRPGTSEWAWPLGPEKMDSLLDRSEAWLGSTESVLPERFAALAEQIDCEVFPKVTAMSANPIRPLSALDKVTQQPAPEIRMQYNAIATQLLCEDGGVQGVLYHDTASGEDHRLDAKVIVLCASAIETTRLLLSSGLEQATPAYSNIGKNYTDHIAASYLAILPEKFTGGTRLGGPLERSATIPSPKNSQRSAQQRGGFTLELNGPNPASIYEPEVLEVAGLQGEEHRDVSCFSVNAMGELCATPERYVTLSDKTDCIGRKIPKICIPWDDETRALAETMEAEAERVAKAIAGPDGQALKVRKTLTLGGTGVSHEAGTCRLGASPEDSVVDLNGQVHGISGLFVGDSSLMPTGLDCHPTLGVLALTFNTADGIVKYLNP